MLILSHITSSAATTAESFFKTLATIVFSKGRLVCHVAQHFEGASRNSHFRLPGLFFTSYFRSPTGRDMRRKLLRNFIPCHQEPIGSCCHLIIFGERSNPPRICESQTSKISVPDLALADRARVLKIQNGRHETQNTRDKGSLILYSYSKRIRKIKETLLIAILKKQRLMKMLEVRNLSFTNHLYFYSRFNSVCLLSFTFSLSLLSLFGISPRV